jgi:hypothetical protein
MSTPTLVDLTFERPNNRQISIMTRRVKDGGSQGEKTNKI